MLGSFYGAMNNMVSAVNGLIKLNNSIKFTYKNYALA